MYKRTTGPRAVLFFSRRHFLFSVHHVHLRTQLGHSSTVPLLHFGLPLLQCLAGICVWASDCENNRLLSPNPETLGVEMEPSSGLVGSVRRSLCPLLPKLAKVLRSSPAMCLEQESFLKQDCLNILQNAGNFQSAFYQRPCLPHSLWIQPASQAGKRLPLL